MVGNFRGRKLLQIGENTIFAEKLSQIACLCRTKGHQTPKFAERIATKP